MTVASVAVSRSLPFTVLKLRLIELGGSQLVLSFPIAILLPLLALCPAFYRIFNSLYLLDDRGIETRTGLLALRQRVVRVRFEDVRSVDTNQTYIERLLNVGRLDVSTASTEETEIVLHAIDAPHEVRDFIERERDLRQKQSRIVSQL